MTHPKLSRQVFAYLVLATLVSPGVSSGEEPKALAGTWIWTWKDGEGKTHKHILDVEAVASKLTARERFDDLESVKVDDMKLKGEEVSFSVKRGERMSEYKGKIVGGKTLNGVVNVVINGQANEFQWTAKRTLDGKKD